MTTSEYKNAKKLCLFVIPPWWLLSYFRISFIIKMKFPARDMNKGSFKVIVRVVSFVIMLLVLGVPFT